MKGKCVSTEASTVQALAPWGRSQPGRLREGPRGVGMRKKGGLTDLPTPASLLGQGVGDTRSCSVVTSQLQTVLPSLPSSVALSALLQPPQLG